MKKYCQNNVQTIQDYTSKPKNQRFKKFFHHSVWKKKHFKNFDFDSNWEANNSFLNSNFFSDFIPLLWVTNLLNCLKQSIYLNSEYF